MYVISLSVSLQASLELVTQERNELETRLDLVCKELSESKDVEQLLLTNLVCYTILGELCIHVFGLCVMTGGSED